MGRLYIAERRGIQGFVKIVALKRILPHLADSEQLREMFLNEARIAARLEHPNIVATYELGEVDGNYFISMEYLPGEDLSAIIARLPGAAARCRSRSRPRWRSRRRRVCTTRTRRATVSGRPIGLVHRDVNPRNIFVTYHGVVKLLDFGVVRGPERQKSIPGVFKGKYGYCAPEQLEGGHVDRRTDVFCLGIALWECLTGARLFDASYRRRRRSTPCARARSRRPAPCARRSRRSWTRSCCARWRAIPRSASRARTTCPRSSIASCSECDERPTTKSGGPLAGDDLRRRAGVAEEVDQPGRRGRSDARAAGRAGRGGRPASGDGTGHRGSGRQRRAGEGAAARDVVDQLRQPRRATGGPEPPSGSAARGRDVRRRAQRIASPPTPTRAARRPRSRRRSRRARPAQPGGAGVAAGADRARSSGWCWRGIAVRRRRSLLRGERSSPDAAGRGGRARDGDAGDTEPSRRARTCSSTAARAAC